MVEVANIASLFRTIRCANTHNGGFASSNIRAPTDRSVVGILGIRFAFRSPAKLYSTFRIM